MIAEAATLCETDKVLFLVSEVEGIHKKTRVDKSFSSASFVVNCRFSSFQSSGYCCHFEAQLDWSRQNRPVLASCEVK